MQPLKLTAKLADENAETVECIDLATSLFICHLLVGNLPLKGQKQATVSAFLHNN